MSRDRLKINIPILFHIIEKNVLKDSFDIWIIQPWKAIKVVVPVAMANSNAFCTRIFFKPVLSCLDLNPTTLFVYWVLSLWNLMSDAGELTCNMQQPWIPLLCCCYNGLLITIHKLFIPFGLAIAIYIYFNDKHHKWKHQPNKTPTNWSQTTVDTIIFVTGLARVSKKIKIWNGWAVQDQILSHPAH